jgi:hypothetical protein
MPPDVEVKPGWHAFIKSMQRPSAQALEWGSLCREPFWRDNSTSRKSMI